ncbi:hypothetical protein NCC78_04185 [Micromonospora phytophila]|uniref:hypothetical protein n=1 Tax=Micromonospora phytophila TaxID=709888 RepID=UPI00202F7585|nr:hypothetical protein [Micromonospora phytophila]MCM0673907.1 hypothetical protein [Micromonospora phytophila]
MSAPVTRVLATTTALTVLTVGSPAQAAPEVNLSGSFATCYGGAKRVYFATGGSGGEAGTFRTTSRCRDINVRNASQFGTEACVIFVNKTDNCNYWTYLPAQSGWITVATNVRDGVDFRVRFDNLRYEYEPLISYHAF